MFSKALLPILALTLAVTAAPQKAKRASCSNGRTAGDEKVRLVDNRLLMHELHHPSPPVLRLVRCSG